MSADLLLFLLHAAYRNPTLIIPTLKLQKKATVQWIYSFFFFFGLMFVKRSFLYLLGKETKIELSFMVPGPTAKLQSGLPEPDMVDEGGLSLTTYFSGHKAPRQSLPQLLL